MLKKLLLASFLLLGSGGLTFVAQAQNAEAAQKGIQISGTVVDAEKESLPGAVITIKGTTNRRSLLY